MRPARLLLAAIAALLGCAARATEVAVCTDHGRFVIELADREAPRHVENFLRYVDMGFYSGTVIHRVVPGFVVQGGGLDRKLLGRPGLRPVANESSNGLENDRGTVAAARGEGPDSATSQFFVNLRDNRELDRAPGYTVFGRVTDGLDVVEAISRLPTGAMGPLKEAVPMPPVVIESIERLDEAALAAVPAATREAALKGLVEAAMSAEDYPAARRWIEAYRAVCGAPDAKLSIDEARAALAVGDPTRARFVLEEYFAVTAQSDPTYEDAVALYRRAVPEQAAQPGDAEAGAGAPIGDCKAPAAPEIPNGASASTEQMVAGQKSVKAFVLDGQAYIKCVDAVADDKARATADRNAAIGEHNRMVGELERSAADFNDQLRAFKARK